MIKKFGEAFKKMAQRSLLRGNRGDANNVTEFGIEGMRNNLLKPEGTTHTGIKNVVHDVYKKETSDNVKANIAAAGSHTVKEKEEANKKLGGSILDAIE